MSDGTRKRGDEGARPTDEALSARLKSLGQRLDQVDLRRASETGPASRPATDHSAFARGFRLSSELVAGVLVGAGLGWLIDRWLGSLPWGMFVFALLGFTAGVLNVMRQAGVVSGGVPDSTIERRND
jgi:ATP synthase protein I